MDALCDCIRFIVPALFFQHVPVITKRPREDTLIFFIIGVDDSFEQLFGLFVSTGITQSLGEELAEIGVAGKRNETFAADAYLVRGMAVIAVRPGLIGVIPLAFVLPGALSLYRV